MSALPEYVRVLVIGGGPAGSALGSYLARAGVECLILEKESFPRPHVGESLVPACNRVLAEIGVLETVDAAGFPRKYGAAWSTDAARAPVYQMDFAGVAFAERELEGARQDYTYHVDRARFDDILLRHAAGCGAAVRENTAVIGTEFDAQTGPHVKVRQENHGSVIRADLVVDASGRDTFLGRRLGLKQNDPRFDHYAVHAWFEDFDRAALARRPGIQDYILIHFLPDTEAWVWQIPITDRITSFGVVTHKDEFRRYGGDMTACFDAFIRRRPDLCDALAGARRATEFRAEGDYSYAMREIAGDGFLLVGDAARFVDPIFSSGVSIALNSARIAADDIIRKLQEAPERAFRKSDFARFEKTSRGATRHWYEFITLYYRLNVLFTHFVEDPRYRQDVLRLLQGDVYDEEPPAVLERMRSVIAEVEKDPEHLWHGFLKRLAPAPS